MAQRKSAPSARTNRPSTGKPGSRTSARPSGAAGRPGSAGARPPARKPNKSIVNQRQTPWGLIITAVVIVAFAAAVIGVVIATHKSSGPNAAGVDPANPYRQPELPAAKAIPGVTYKVEPNHTHMPGVLHYDATPPVGGNHSQYWADCTGTIYAQPIANENAVHMLEHGAIWVTYNAKTLPASQLAILKKDVAGVDRMALSPYPNLKTPISLQAWGYQLFVHKATDPRINEFIGALKYNPKITPEYGATCSQPTFKDHPSTFGHPLWVPANGASGNTMGR
jgi:hypothetical protein